MNGILPLWKEKGCTSHDCVFQLRKILRTKKVGHTGTLDPNVEGVLPICIGQATKLSDYIMNSGKEYVATVCIGQATETEDADGRVVKEDTSLKKITRVQIEDVLQKLTGDITQIPPMYSAVKVRGKKLYEYARLGQIVERPERTVQIHAIDLLSSEDVFEGEAIEFSIRVVCGKGTYIRTLAVQIGELLGYPAHMSALVRTASGSFHKEQCLTLQQVAKLQEEDVVKDVLRPIEQALTDFPFVEIDEEYFEKIANGQVLPQHEELQTSSSVVFTKDAKAIAIYQVHPTKEGLMKPEKMLLGNR